MSLIEHWQGPALSNILFHNLTKPHSSSFTRHENQFGSDFHDDGKVSNKFASFFLLLFSGHLLSHLLAGHVQLDGQSNHLLLYEQKVKHKQHTFWPQSLTQLLPFTLGSKKDSRRRSRSSFVRVFFHLAEVRFDNEPLKTVDQ